MEKRCKTFSGNPRNVGNDINKWFDENREKKLGEKILSVTQSFEETHGNMMITIIYEEYKRQDV
jgi:hypothetical protein